MVPPTHHHHHHHNHTRSSSPLDSGGPHRVLASAPFSSVANTNPILRCDFLSNNQELIVSNLLGTYVRRSQPNHQGRSGTPEKIRDAFPVAPYKLPISRTDGAELSSQPRRHQNNTDELRSSGKEPDSAVSQCIICLQRFEPKELIKWLPCVHAFHVKCIDAWLNHSVKCPVCQLDVNRSDISSSITLRSKQKKCSMLTSTRRQQQQQQNSADRGQQGTNCQPAPSPLVEQQQQQPDPLPNPSFHSHATVASRFAKSRDHHTTLTALAYSALVNVN